MAASGLAPSIRIAAERQLTPLSLIVYSAGVTERELRKLELDDGSVPFDE
jgi:hypothetical protein